MKATIKDEVLRFMVENDTKDMNSNEFVYRFIEHTYGGDKIYIERFFLRIFLESSSVESITRGRRFINKTHGMIRIDADKQEEYIKEFSLNNKI